jgi:WD40 repeat protein
MAVLENHNILKTIFSNYTLLEARQRFNEIKSKTICLNITSRIFNKHNIFKSMGKEIKFLGRGLISILALLPNGDIISAYEETLKIWSISQKKCIRTLHGHREFINSIIVLQNGYIASCGMYPEIKIWNLNSQPECIKTLKLGSYNSPTKLFLLSNGNIACSRFGRHQRYMSILDCQNDFECIKEISDEQGPQCIVSLANGLIASQNCYSICIYDINDDYKLVKELLRENVTSLIYVQATGLLITGNDNGMICVYNVNRNYKCIKKMEAHKKSIGCFCLLSDGYLASGSYDTTIKIWDLNNYECINTLYGSEYINGLLLLKDGRIASAEYEVKGITIYNY